MTPETINRCVTELRRGYPGAERADEGYVALVRLPLINFPLGCQPLSTRGIVILDPGQPKPRLLIEDRPKTPGGATPRNVNLEMAGGEAWFCFSFNVPWDENRHSALQFVESALRRFAKDE